MTRNFALPLIVFTTLAAILTGYTIGTPDGDSRAGLYGLIGGILGFVVANILCFAMFLIENYLFSWEMRRSPGVPVCRKGTCSHYDRCYGTSEAQSQLLRLLTEKSPIPISSTSVVRCECGDSYLNVDVPDGTRYFMLAIPDETPHPFMKKPPISSLKHFVGVFRQPWMVDQETETKWPKIPSDLFGQLVKEIDASRRQRESAEAALRKPGD